MYIYRKFGRKFGSDSLKGPEGHALGTLLTRIGNDKFRFSPDAIAPILQENGADIDWMEARLGTPLRENWGQRRAGDVSNEAELLTVKPSTVARLLHMLGSAAPAGIAGVSNEEIALLVHALREQHGSRDRQSGAVRGASAESPRMSRHRDDKLRIRELIERLRKRNPAVLDGITAERAEMLIHGAFQEVSAVLAETAEGMVQYSGLGRFRVRKVDMTVDGASVSRTRITFHHEPPRNGADQAKVARRTQTKRKRNGKSKGRSTINTTRSAAGSK
jgi:hypothetical protein